MKFWRRKETDTIINPLEDVVQNKKPVIQMGGSSVLFYFFLQECAGDGFIAIVPSLTEKF